MFMHSIQSVGGDNGNLPISHLERLVARLCQGPFRTIIWGRDGGLSTLYFKMDIDGSFKLFYGLLLFKFKVLTSHVRLPI